MADPSPTIAALATTLPGALRVLQRHGLDACAGGEATLGELCAAGGLDPVHVLAEIEGGTTEEAELPPWDALSIDEVLRHVETQVHEPLRQELPRLVELARAVEHGHRGERGCPVGLAAHLEELRECIELHMQKEEQVLFPLLRAGRGALALVPIQMMEEEHHDHGAALRRTRELTGGLCPPAAAGAPWRALYDRLRQLERELMAHIHLENHVLFPRAARHSGP